MTSQPRLQPGSPEWRALVTPSKIGAILNISPYTDQYSMWHYMSGNIEIPETDEMRRGNYHEAAVLREFYHRHPDLKRIPGSKRTHRVNAWFAVTPDSLATDRKPVTDRRMLVEAKTAAYWDEWGEEGTDEVPEHYYAQVITAAHGIKADEIRVFVLGPFWEYREYVVQPDPELAEQVLARCHPFWLSVQNRVEPELSHTASAYETWTKVNGADVGSGDVEIDRDLALRMITVAAAEKQVKATKAEIVNLLDASGAHAATYRGQTVCQKQKNSAGGVSLFMARKVPDLGEPTELETA